MIRVAGNSRWNCQDWRKPVLLGLPLTAVITARTIGKGIEWLNPLLRGAVTSVVAHKFHFISSTRIFQSCPTGKPNTIGIWGLENPPKPEGDLTSSPHQITTVWNKIFRSALVLHQQFTIGKLAGWICLHSSVPLNSSCLSQLSGWFCTRTIPMRYVNASYPYTICIWIGQGIGIARQLLNVPLTYTLSSHRNSWFMLTSKFTVLIVGPALPFLHKCRQSRNGFCSRASGAKIKKQNYPGIYMAFGR